MELSTVSTPPNSTTEGHDLCEIDVTNVAIHSMTLLICLCGLFGNGAVLCLLRLRLTNRRIFDLSVVDFLFLLFTVPCALFLLLEDVSCSLIVPLGYLRFLFKLSVFSQYWGLVLLTDFRVVMHMCMRCWLWCSRCLSKRLFWLVLGIELWAFIALTAVITTVPSLCPSHQQQQCQAALITVIMVFLLLLAAPTVISTTIKFIKAKWVIPCTIKFIKVKCSSQQQQLKRCDIAICLVVLFTLVLMLWNFLQQLGYTVVSSQVFLLLTCINSSIKPFIYFLLGRCWRSCSLGSFRESLQRVFDEQKDNTAPRNDAKTDTGIQRLLIHDNEQLILETLQLICDTVEPTRDTVQPTHYNSLLTRYNSLLTRYNSLLRNPETVPEGFP